MSLENQAWSHALVRWRDRGVSRWTRVAQRWGRGELRAEELGGKTFARVKSICWKLSWQQVMWRSSMSCNYVVISLGMPKGSKDDSRLDKCVSPYQQIPRLLQPIVPIFHTLEIPSQGTRLQSYSCGQSLWILIHGTIRTSIFPDRGHRTQTPTRQGL